MAIALTRVVVGGLVAAWAISTGCVSAAAGGPGPAGRIVFVSDLPAPLQAEHLYLLSADGTRLDGVGGPGEEAQAEPAFAPDGERIAFIERPAGDPQSLWLENRDGSDRRLLSDSDNPGSPAWSADGTRIAYVSYPFKYDQHPPSLIVLSLAGTGGGFVAADATSPAWSPDGHHLAYVHAGSSLLVRDLASGEEQTLLSAPAGHSLSGLAWAPDGTTLALLDTGGAGNRGVVEIVSSTGGHATPLTPPAASDGMPTWSPDSRRLALIRSTGSGPTARTSIDSIALDSADTRVLRALPPRSSGTLSWSSRGEIAFAVAFATPFPYRIHQLPAAGGHARVLDANPLDSQPALSRDGALLAVTRAGQDGSTIVIRDLRSGHTHPLATPSALDQGALGDPAWAPDGRRLAFTVIAGRGRGIYIARSDGSRSRRLVGGDSGSPTWSADGKRVAFVRDYDTLFSIGSNGRGLRRLGRGRNPDWSPSGERIAFDVNGVVYTSDANGRRRRSIGPGTDPAWSPDGRQLVAVGQQGGDRELVVLAASGHARRLLTRDFADETQPDWGTPLSRSRGPMP